MSGRLYLVPTPIGHPGDLAPRSAEVLRSVAVIAAEDTRVARALLGALGGGSAEVVRYDDHTERGQSAALVARLVAGDAVALVSDAGTPLCSDPGYRLVVGAIAAGVPVVPLPGPNAAITALIASGLPTDRYLFAGFPPRQGGPRTTWFQSLRAERGTLVLYEAPHRILDTLAAARAVLGDRPACLAISLTKVWERFHRGPLSAVADGIAGEGEILGEMVLVIGGAPEAVAEEEARALALARQLAVAGVSPGVIRDALGDAFAVPRRALYQAALAVQGERS